MKLPEKFQFRAKDEPAFTHTAKLVKDKYQVKWARGFERHFMEKHCLKKFADSDWNVSSAERQVELGSWLVVEEAPQKQALPLLPDEFYFKVLGQGHAYKMTLVDGYFRCTTAASDTPPLHGAPHNVQDVKRNVKGGVWVIVNVLTAEQKRANKEAREQVQALESSIKISQQAIAHKERLIASYEERKQDLLNKIVEE